MAPGCAAMSRPRAWLQAALEQIEADQHRSADTHLIAVPMPAYASQGIDFYLKDESTHPTGSLKHRLARSLFLYALSNGWLHEASTVVEASSGSPAVSEAYLARLIGLPFVAVVPRGTSAEKIAQIEFYGGRCHLVDSADQVSAAARQVAAETGGHFMDQFTYAERATDWRGNNNIAISMLTQMQRERHPVPRWVVMAAGTGGTSATIGRYLRYRQLPTELCVVDPEGSVVSRYWQSGDAALTAAGSRIEGIGRPRVEASFIRTVVDRMRVVPDGESIAAMRALSAILGRPVGPSTGTHFAGMLALAAEMGRRAEHGSIVSLLCDSGARYQQTYHDPQWVDVQFGPVSAAESRISALIAGRIADEPAGAGQGFFVGGGPGAERGASSRPGGQP